MLHHICKLIKGSIFARINQCEEKFNRGRMRKTRIMVHRHLSPRSFSVPVRSDSEGKKVPAEGVHVITQYVKSIGSAAWFSALILRSRRQLQPEKMVVPIPHRRRMRAPVGVLADVWSEAVTVAAAVYKRPDQHCFIVHAQERGGVVKSLRRRMYFKDPGLRFQLPAPPHRPEGLRRERCRPCSGVMSPLAGRSR